MRILPAFVFALASAIACGPGSATPVVPSLPGDGDDNTAQPKDPTIIPAGADDPWKDRELIEPPAPFEARPLALPKPTRFKLKNGLEVIAIPSARAPVVSVQLAVRVGRADASRDLMGIEQVVAQTMTAGTRKRSADALQTTLADAAASLHVQASFENTLISCQARADALAACLATIPDVVANPSFPNAAFEAARAELARTAALRHEDPAQLAAMHFQNLLWGDQHVRGWPTTERTVSAVKRKDVIAWHRSWFQPRNAVLAIAGDFDPSKLRATLDRAFAGWRNRGKLPKRNTYKIIKRDRVAARVIDWPDEDSAHVRIGHLGIEHKDPTLHHAVVMNEILGGGRNSRVDRRLAKETKGRALGASSGFDRNADAGIFVISAATTSKDALASVRSILQEMTRLQEGAPTTAEMTAAITRLGGAYVTSLETSAQIANAYLASALHDLGDDFVRMYPVALAEVTGEDARKAAEAVLDPVTPAVTIVGDARTIGPQLQAIGVAFDLVKRTDPVGGWERAGEPEDTEKAAADAARILAKALQAKGGAAKLASITSIVLEGEARGVVHDPKAGKQTFEASVKRTYVAPDKMRRDIARQVGNQTALSGIVLSGDSAWAFEKMGKQEGAGELPPALVQALKTQMWRDQELILLRYRDKDTTALALADQSIDGKPHHVVRITRDDGTASTLFIDKKSYLVRRQSYSEQGSSATESYDDYKSVGGIQVPHRRVTTEGATRFDMEIKKIQFNVTVPADVFAKPK